MTIRELFKHYAETSSIFLKDPTLVDRTLSRRPDLRAFQIIDRILIRTFERNKGVLDKLEKSMIIEGTSHNVVWLCSLSSIEKQISEEEVLSLVICGVSYDEGGGSLYMNV